MIRPMIRPIGDFKMRLGFGTGRRSHRRGRYAILKLPSQDGFYEPRSPVLRSSKRRLTPSAAKVQTDPDSRYTLT